MWGGRKRQKKEKWEKALPGSFVMLKTTDFMMKKRKNPNF